MTCRAIRPRAGALQKRSGVGTHDARRSFAVGKK